MPAVTGAVYFFALVALTAHIEQGDVPYPFARQKS
jgi:hypothetical protein